jgi:hypothetical protein
MAPMLQYQGSGNSFYSALGRTHAAKQYVQVCSLGSSCGVALTIKNMGLDNESMPFDWARTSVDGLMQWLKEGFNSYFNGPFKRYEIVFRSSPMTVYRSTNHAFWHDDIEDGQTIEKLKRRTNRFNELATDAKASPGRALLFVRTLCGTNELIKTEALYQALETRFGCKGRQVYLLAIIEDQGTKGPILHERHPNLMFWLQPLTNGPLNEQAAPYTDAIDFACRRILKDPTAMTPQGGGNILQVQSVHEVSRKGGFRDSEAGLWCGMVQIKGVEKPKLFCAFEGYSHRENLEIPQGSNQLAYMGIVPNEKPNTQSTKQLAYMGVVPNEKPNTQSTKQLAYNGSRANESIEPNEKPSILRKLLDYMIAVPKEKPDAQAISQVAYNGYRASQSKEPNEEKPDTLGEAWEDVLRPIANGVGAIIAALGAAGYGAVSTISGFLDVVPLAKNAAVGSGESAGALGTSGPKPTEYQPRYSSYRSSTPPTYMSNSPQVQYQPTYGSYPSSTPPPTYGSHTSLPRTYGSYPNVIRANVYM